MEISAGAPGQCSAVAPWGLNTSYRVIGDRGVERIEDDNIGPLWVEHYPKRKVEPASQLICLSLLAIVMRKAIMTIPYGNRYEKLILALAEFGIPENQFWELDNEIKTM